MGFNGTNVPITKITPAELVLLVTQWKDYAKRHPIHNLAIVGSVKRDTQIEIDRLKSKYGKRQGEKKLYKIEELYPGTNPSIPQTFEETGLLKDSMFNMLAEPVPAPEDVKEDEVLELADAISFS